MSPVHVSYPPYSNRGRGHDRVGAHAPGRDRDGDRLGARARGARARGGTRRGHGARPRRGGQRRPDGRRDRAAALGPDRHALGGRLGGRRGGRHRRSGPGRAVGAARRLAGRRHPPGAAPRRQGRRLGRLEPQRQSYTKTTDHTFTRATVYDPATGTQTPAWVHGLQHLLRRARPLWTDRCSPPAATRISTPPASTSTYTFDYATKQWTRGPNMAFPRWYPSVTPLPNGEMLITGGRPRIPEVRGTDGSIRSCPSRRRRWTCRCTRGWTSRPTAACSSPAPTTCCASWIPAAAGMADLRPRGDGMNRDYGGHALYDIGKILVAGGGTVGEPARTIDINGATPQVSPTSPMAFGRRQFNLTVLADGTVLATGGNSTGDAISIDMNGGVYNAELWNPATGGLDDARRRAGHAPVPLQRAAAARRPRAVGRRAASATTATTSATSGRTARSSARRTCSRRTARAAGAASDDQRRRRARLPYGAAFSITTPNAASIQKVGAHTARGGDALGQLGAALHAALVHRGRRHAEHHRAAERQRGAAGLLHALHRRRRRRALGREDGANQRRRPASAPAAAADPPSADRDDDQPANGASFTAPADVHLAATRPTPTARS